MCCLLSAIRSLGFIWCTPWSRKRYSPVQSPSSMPRTASSVDFPAPEDRKSTRLNSSHSQISYAVFCLKKKTKFVDEQLSDLDRATHAQRLRGPHPEEHTALRQNHRAQELSEHLDKPHAPSSSVHFYL